jgi:two-component system sensor histidine kinase/response regulator
MERILLAEDNAINREILEAMVRKDGFEVHSVINGREAVDAVCTQDFSCILMDIHMPVMDGIEATRQIRALENLKASIPIIAVSASVEKGIREQALDAGMNEFIPKPVDMALLRDALTRFSVQ